MQVLSNYSYIESHQSDKARLIIVDELIRLFLLSFNLIEG